MKKVVILLALALFSTVAYAQGPGFGSGDPNEDTVPIDGGVSILAAGAAAYGYKKLKARKLALKK
jgi:hypothetical protein